MALNEVGLAVGAIRNGLQVSRVIDASIGKYVWQAITSGATTANMVDKTPATVPATIAALETAVPAAGQPATERWEALYGTAGNYQYARVIAGAWVDAEAGGSAPAGTVVNVTPATQPATLAALETAVPAAGKPLSLVWEASYGTAGDTKTARVIGGIWQAVDASAVATGFVVDVTPATIPVSLAALAVAIPVAGQPATETWQSWYGAPGALGIAQIIGGAWTPIAAPASTGFVRNVTPIPIPTTIGALQTAVPAAGQPTTETWQSVIGAPGSYQQAEIVAGVWTIVDRPANQVDVTPATIPADLVALQAAVPAAGEVAPNQWVALYGTAPDYHWAAVIGGVWTETTHLAGVMVGATPTTSGRTGTVPIPTSGQHDLVLHGDGLWRELFPAWAPATTYSAGATVISPTGGLVKRIAAGLSGATYDTNEALGWQAIAGAAGTAMSGATGVAAGTGGVVPAPPIGAQDLPLHGDATYKGVAPDWVAARAYSAGALAIQGGALYRRKTAGTSGATFDATELANWDPLSSLDQLQDRSGDLNVPAIAAGVLPVNVANGAAFDATLTENLTGVTYTWLPTATYPQFQTITVRLKQDATGGRTVNFAAFGTIIGETPSLDLTANANPAAIFNVVTFDGGATRYVLPILTDAAEEEIGRGTALPDPGTSTFDAFIVTGSAGEPDGLWFRYSNNWILAKAVA